MNHLSRLNWKFDLYAYWKLNIKLEEIDPFQAPELSRETLLSVGNYCIYLHNNPRGLSGYLVFYKPFDLVCHWLLLSGIVKKLLSIWPELCKFCDSSNTSPLYSSAVQDHLDVVNAILDADASSVRIVRKNGKTALHTAARYGLVRIVKALMDRDPGIVCIKDKKGQTALHMAVKGQSTAAVEDILLADSSILNERDKKGNTAVHIATRKSRPLVICLVILNYADFIINFSSLVVTLTCIIRLPYFS